MAGKDQLTRKGELRRYAELDALDTFLHNFLLEFNGEPSTPYDALLLHHVGAEEVGVYTRSTDPAETVVTCHDAHNGLWPADSPGPDYEDTAEWKSAQAMICATTARLCARLATDEVRTWLLREAERQAALAESAALEVAVMNSPSEVA
jgi:hypothetical protein